jgi:hypothetical protein
MQSSSPISLYQTSNAPTWLDGYIANNSVSLLNQTQSAIDIYMSSVLPNGQIPSLGYWQVANGYSAMALHDMWAGSTSNMDCLVDNLIKVSSDPMHADFINDFNDDTMWYALAALDTYTLTNSSSSTDSESLIRSARTIWTHVSNYTLASGTIVNDTDMGGGVRWTSHSTSPPSDPSVPDTNGSLVNSITTSLYAELSARLAHHELPLDSTQKHSTYLSAAQAALKWILRVRFDPTTWLVLDQIDIATGEEYDWTFSYTTGGGIAASAAIARTMLAAPPGGPSDHAERPGSASSSTTPASEQQRRSLNHPHARPRDAPQRLSQQTPTPLTRLLDPTSAADYLSTALTLALHAITQPKFLDAQDLGILSEPSAYPGIEQPLNATTNSDAVGFKAVLVRSIAKLGVFLSEVERGDWGPDIRNLSVEISGADDTSEVVGISEAKRRLKIALQRQFLGIMALARPLESGAGQPSFGLSSSSLSNSTEESTNATTTNSEGYGSATNETEPMLIDVNDARYESILQADVKMQFGPWWTGPFDTPTAWSQLAALDVLAGIWALRE